MYHLCEMVSKIILYGKHKIVEVVVQLVEESS